MCSTTKHHSLIGMPDVIIQARIMVSSSCTALSAGPTLMSASSCYLKPAASCQELPLQFGFMEFAGPITDHNSRPHTHPSHKLQKYYREMCNIRLTDNDLFVILPVNEDRIIVKASSGSNCKFSTRLHVDHFPFRELLLLINIHCHPWKCLSLLRASQEDWTFEFELYEKVAWQVRCLELIGRFTKPCVLDQAFHKASQNFDAHSFCADFEFPRSCWLQRPRCPPRRICKRTSPCEDTRCLYLVYPTTVFWRLDH